MPGTRQPKDKRIQDIIEAALIEFSRNGYDAVRMEDIAERAGMNRSTVYYYFQHKDAILAAVRGRIFEPIQVMMNAAGAGDPVEGVRKFIHDYLQFWATHPREQEFYLLGTLRTLQNRAWWPYVNVYVAAMINWYDMMLTRGVKSGRLRKHDTHTRATALFCAVEGAVPYVTMAKIFKVKRAAKDIAKTLIEETMNDE